jgi:hypothetical protein
MKPSTPPQRRRRRRWLIVALVLVLVSTVSWWYWPRGDARFVGRWARNPGSLSMTTSLSRNGTGITRGDPSWPVRAERWTVVYSWRVEGDQFIKEPLIPNGQISTAVNGWVGRAGYKLLDKAERYTIVLDEGAYFPMFSLGNERGGAFYSRLSE